MVALARREYSIGTRLAQYRHDGGSSSVGRGEHAGTLDQMGDSRMMVE